VLVRVVQAGFLHDSAAVLDDLNLTLDLAVNGALHEAERVDVLDLGAGAELALAFRSNRDVTVAAHGAFGHVAVADTQVGDDGVNLPQVGHGFLGTANIRLGHDFQQWGTGAVEVDAGHAVEVFVQRLARVFFQMGTGHADGFLNTLFQLDRDLTFAHDGRLKLTGLVALGQVGVEVVLAVEHRALADLGIDGQA